MSISRSVRPVRSLPDVMGYLLPTGAPPAWTASVRRAAQLLGPSWTQAAELPQATLATLALALYTLAHEHQVDPADVPLADVREVLTGRHRHGGEPTGLHDRIGAALPDIGDAQESGGAMSAVRRIYGRLADQWEPDEPTADMEPAVSALRDAADLLLRLLDGLDDGQAALLPPAPAPAGVLRIGVSGRVMLAATTGSGFGVVALRCPDCGAHTGNSVLLDGPIVGYLCPDGHRSDPPQLTVGRVRAAVATLFAPDSGEFLPAGAEGEFQVQGDLEIVLA